MTQDNVLEEMIWCLKRRSRRAQWISQAFFLFTIIAVVGAVILASYIFARVVDAGAWSEIYLPYDESYSPGGYTVTYLVPQDLSDEDVQEHIELFRALEDEFKERTLLDKAIQKEQELRKKIESMDLDTTAQKLEGRQEESRILLFSIITGAAGISAVALCLYLPAFFISISRYHLRISRHLDILADSFFIVGIDDLEVTRDLINAFHGSTESSLQR